MTERDLAAAIEDLCKYLGVTYYHAWSSKHSVAGWPDYALITRDHRFLVRELKTATGRLTAAQTRWLVELQAAGVDAGVWRPEDLTSGRVLKELSPIRNLQGCS
jgi:hypothetical protein